MFWNFNLDFHLRCQARRNKPRCSRKSAARTPYTHSHSNSVLSLRLGSSFRPNRVPSLIFLTSTIATIAIATKKGRRPHTPSSRSQLLTVFYDSSSYFSPRSTSRHASAPANRRATGASWKRYVTQRYHYLLYESVPTQSLFIHRPHQKRCRRSVLFESFVPLLGGMCWEATLFIQERVSGF